MPALDRLAAARVAVLRVARTLLSAKIPRSPAPLDGQQCPSPHDQALKREQPTGLSPCLASIVAAQPASPRHAGSAGCGLFPMHDLMMRSSSAADPGSRAQEKSARG